MFSCRTNPISRDTGMESQHRTWGKRRKTRKAISRATPIKEEDGTTYIRYSRSTGMVKKRKKVRLWSEELQCQCPLQHFGIFGGNFTLGGSHMLCFRTPTYVGYLQRGFRVCFFNFKSSSYGSFWPLNTTSVGVTGTRLPPSDQMNGKTC